MAESRIRVDFATIDTAVTNMQTLRAAIEGHIGDLDRSIAELQVWDGAAAAECQARNQELKAAWTSIEGQLDALRTTTAGFNQGAQETEDAIRRSFAR